MDYILIYDIVEETDFHFFIDSFKVAFELMFIFSSAYSLMKKSYSKKKFIKAYLYSFLFCMVVDLFISIYVKSTISNGNFLKKEGEIYNYKKTSNNYESFYVDGHKFQSANRYGFDYEYKGNKVIFKNGDKVKIYYSGTSIFKFWIEYKSMNTSKKRELVSILNPLQGRTTLAYDYYPIQPSKQTNFLKN